jgi:drug/metabolite transporter (DMT)-like permease
MIFPYFGEACALSCAVIWAFAVIMFRKSGETAHPIALNLFKNVLGLVLLLATGWILGRAINPTATGQDYLLLCLSGALGIGISDTLFFKSLNLLGAGLSAIVDCLYSPFIIGMSMLWLGERLHLVQVFGVLMIVSAVFVATFEKNSGTITRRNLTWGVIYGILAMVTVALGIVMIKPMLAYSPLLWVTEVRLAAGGVVLLLLLLFRTDRRKILGSMMAPKGWKFMIVGSFLGAYLSLVLWLAGMKYTTASIAASLNQTSNIFVFIFAGVFLKEVINLQRIIGIILGVGGVFLVMMV